MRFSKIDQLIPPEDHDDQLSEYYELIKNFDGCSRNQFFWLQYAIARITLNQFPLAEQYLNTAFALASRIPNFNTYQMDNTKARLLLSRSLARPENYNGFQDFVQAHRILLSQMKQGTHGYYPFRVASAYGQYWDRLVPAWSGDQKDFFLSACDAVNTRLSVVDRHLSVHADVKRCTEAISRILGLSS